MFWKKKNQQNEHKKESDSGSYMPGISGIKVIIKTDLGNVRSNNEDYASSFRIAEENPSLEKGYLLIIADGMGGHLAGEVASKMAVGTISEEYLKQASERNKEKILTLAFNSANKKILDLATANEQYRGMGTTCTALAISGQTIYYAHAGDSRAYLYKNKSIIRITEDHTFVQELVKKGEITIAEADIHPQRNILTNAMGTKPGIRIDTGKCIATLEQNDRLMLCSDGLYDYLTDTEIAEVMQHKSLREAADYFITEAKRRGGMDNITVVLAEAEAVSNEKILKSTRDVVLPKLTRDADL